MHTFFEVDRHVPSKIITTGGTARGEDAERSVMEANREKTFPLALRQGEP